MEIEGYVSFYFLVFFFQRDGEETSVGKYTTSNQQTRMIDTRTHTDDFVQISFTRASIPSVHWLVLSYFAECSRESGWSPRRLPPLEPSSARPADGW